jgi:hypothetical protein
MRRLLKFKTGSSRTEVLAQYEIDRGNPDDGMDKITLESSEMPSMAVIGALQAMARHMVDIAELPADWLDDLTIIGVTVTHTNDVQGLVITATRKLENSNAPLVLNTPHFTRCSYNEDPVDDKGIFSGDCGDDLDALEKLVFAYVDGGERTQLTLQFTREPAAVSG